MLRRPEEVPCSRMSGCVAAPSAGRWVPQGLADQPAYVFETGARRASRSRGTTARLPHRLRNVQRHAARGILSAGSQLADARALRARGGCGSRSSTSRSIGGGICFCVDLDPRWVIKLIQKGWMEHLEGLQAALHRPGDHDPRSAATTSAACSRRPNSSRPSALALEKKGTTHPPGGDHRHLLRRHRVHAAVDPLRRRRTPRRRLHDAHLRQHAHGPRGQPARDRRRRLHDRLLRPAAPAVIEVVDFDKPDELVPYGGTGRVRLTTLTKETFIPGFLERLRGRARTARTRSIHGTASAASCPCPICGSPPPRPSACIRQAACEPKPGSPGGAPHRLRLRRPTRIHAWILPAYRFGKPYEVAQRENARSLR